LKQASTHASRYWLDVMRLAANQAHAQMQQWALVLASADNSQVLQGAVNELGCAAQSTTSFHCAVQLVQIYDFAAVITTVPLSAASIVELQRLTSQLWGRPVPVLMVSPHPMPSPQPGAPSDTLAPSSSRESDGSVVRGVQVLYVEDSKLCQRMVTQLLSQHGVQCKSVDNGQAALAELRVGESLGGLVCCGTNHHAFRF
jgi:CheY-like chemotaxis protein